MSAQRYSLAKLVPGAVLQPPPKPKSPALTGVYVGHDAVLTRTWTNHLMYVSTRDSIVGPHLINLGFNEPHNTRILSSLIKPGDVFVDAGANIGYFSVLAGWRSHPGGAVWSFEPLPHAYRLLFDNLAINGFLNAGHTHRVALSDQAGSAKMRVFPGYEATSTLRHLSEDDLAGNETWTGRASEVIEVSTVRLDDIMKDVPEIHVMKIDIEGHEPAMIRGATEIIARSKNLRIVMEFAPYTMAREDALGNLELLRELGFSAYRIEDDATLSPQPNDTALLDIPFSDLFLLRQ